MAYIKIVLFLVATLALGPAAAWSMEGGRAQHTHRRALHEAESAEAEGPAPAAGTPLASRIRPSIVVIGDGLTESSFNSQSPGFGSLLEDKYKRKVSVLCGRLEATIGVPGASRADGRPT